MEDSPISPPIFDQAAERAYNDTQYMPKDHDATTATDPAGDAATSQANIDAYGGVIITLTGAGNAQTMQDPSDTAVIKRFIVVTDDANGAHTITVQGIVMSAGEAQWFIWDASAWVAITAVDAEDIAFTPTGNIVATNTQAAVAEVDNEKIAKTTLSNVQNTKVKLDATTAPTVNNDVDEGYSVLSRWADITADKEYVCLDNTDGAAVWEETTQSGASAHKDDHDPEDGSDPLDTAAPAELAGVQAAGAGSSHSFARSDHAHQVQHGIADNHIVTIDHDAPVSGDYAKFTASGLEGRETSEILSDIGVAAGADVTGSNAPQAHKTSHQNTGGDEISVTGLSGLLADDQHVLDSEVIAVALAKSVTVALGSDHSWTGPVQTITAGENLAIFETAYLKSDGKYWKTDADAEATAKGKIVMATAAINADASGIALLPSPLSFIRDDSTTEWTVTNPGDEMYLSTTGGELTNDVSGYTTLDIVRICGYMETAVILNFNVDKTYVETP